MKERLTFSNTVSVVALFAALAGGAYALETGSIGSREIKDGSLKSKDFKDRNLKGKDLKDGTIAARQLKDGSITAGDLKDGTIAGSEILDDAITGTDVNESSLVGVRPGGAAGGELAGAYPNPRLADGTVGPAEQADLPHLKAIGSTQTLQDGVVTKIAIGGPVSSSGMTFDNANDTVEVDVPGVYAISGFICWSPNSTGRRVVQIQRDGQLLIEDSRDPVDGARTSQSIVTLERLPAGAVLSLAGQQTSGGALDTKPAGSPEPELNVWWVGP